MLIDRHALRRRIETKTIEGFSKQEIFRAINVEWLHRGFFKIVIPKILCNYITNFRPKLKGNKEYFRIIQKSRIRPQSMTVNGHSLQQNLLIKINV